jgi:hypothetical protein
MSDLEFDNDDVEYFNGFPIEALNDLKDEERTRMLAERAVDSHIRRYGLKAIVVPRKGYEHGTKEWAARLLVEAEEEEEQNNEDEELDVDDTDASLDRIEKVDAFLKVVKSDMQEIREQFEEDLRVLWRIKHYRNKMDRSAAASAGITIDTQEFVEDGVTMTRMKLMVASMMEQELHVRKNLYAEQKAILDAMRVNYVRRHEERTKKVFATMTVNDTTSSSLPINS